jgi:hypothetical protein
MDLREAGFKGVSRNDLMGFFDDRKKPQLYLNA